MMQKIKSIIKSSNLPKTILIWLWNISHNRISCSKKNILIKGLNSRFTHCVIEISGKNNHIEFGNDCVISGLRMLVLGDNNEIHIGNRVVINGSKIQPTTINAVGNSKIIIEDYCLFSNNIEIHTTDYHGIYNKDGERINFDRDIFIGSHSWIGLDWV